MKLFIFKKVPVNSPLAYFVLAFIAMATLVFLGMVFLLFLPAFPIDSSPIRQTMPLSELFGNTVLLLLAILFYQCAASAIWAYVRLIGLSAGIASESVSMYIATTGMLGLVGAMLPVISGKRFGRLYWVLSGIALSIIAAVLLSFFLLFKPVQTQDKAGAVVNGTDLSLLRC